MAERLGKGEFRTRGLPDRAKKHAQGIFLQQLQILVPACLEDLCCEVLPLFGERERDIYRTADLFTQPHRVDTSVVFSVLLGESCPHRFLTGWQAFAVPREAMWAWARRYRIEEAWIVAAAAETVGLWLWGGTPEQLADLSEDPWTFSPEPRWVHGIFNQSLSLSREDRRFAFQHSGWDVERQTQPDFSTELVRQFADALAAYVSRIEHLAALSGWERTRSKTGQSNPRRHFDWLVRYQVQGWSHRRIEEECHVSRQTISKYIRETADVIDLRLRPPSTGGRPQRPVADDQTS